MLSFVSPSYANPVGGGNSPRLEAAAGMTAGTAGQFVPLQGRLFNTLTAGSGGTAAPLTPLVWTSVQVNGTVGLPASGIKAVTVNITVVSPAAQGWIQLAPNTSLPTTQTSFMVHGDTDTVSNTGIVEVGTDGKIAIKAEKGVNVLIDVQGYFTVGNGIPVPGGFVPVAQSRIVDTRITGTALPLARLAGGSNSDVSVFGLAGIPTTATAVFVNITVVSYTAATGYLTVFPAGTTRPGTSINFEPNVGYSATATALGTTADLNSAGQFSIYVGGVTAPIDLTIDVQGYFDGQVTNSGFTATQGRVYDSRIAPNVILGPNSVTSVQISGVGAIPAAASNLVGVALNFSSVNATTTYSTVRAWPSDSSEPYVTDLFVQDGMQSSLAIIRPGATDGKINIRNTGPVSIDLILDAEGWFINNTSLPPASVGDPAQSGSRSAANMIGRSLTDRVSANINPTNGNLVLTQQLLSLTGVGVQASVNMRYNSLNDNRPTLNTGFFEQSLFRQPSGNIVYTAPDGGGYVFTPTATAGQYAVPAGINAHLTRIGAGGAGSTYELISHPAQTKNKYVDNGSVIYLASTEDVTGANKITYTYTGNLLTSLTDSQGRIVTFTYASTANPSQPTTITDTSVSRSVVLTYAGPSGALSRIVDAAGSQTDYAYGSNGKISQITDGKGQVTKFTYGTGNKFASLVAAFGTPVAGTWAMSYAAGTPSPTDSVTTATDANGKNSTIQFVTLTRQVTKVTDANGNASTSIWNAHSDLTSRTNAGANTTDFTVAAGSYNLTQTTAPNGGTVSGRTQKWDYTLTPSGPGGTYSTADYRPNKGTDAQGNYTNYVYNPWGQPNSVQVGNGTGGLTSFTYHGVGGASCGGKNGQLCRKTDPKGNITNYTYNTTGNLITIDNPAPLGDVTMTYDNAGRVKTRTDGRANTVNYCYDANDRITQTSYTSANCALASGLTYAYDLAGNLSSRASTVGQTGTTTFAYDQQNRTTSKVTPTPAGNLTTSATYDVNGNVLTYTDAGGAITYRYDNANRLTFMAEPGGSCSTTPAFPNTTKCIKFDYDPTGIRTKTTFPSNFTNTMTYDTSNRMISVTGRLGAAAPLVSRTYSWNTAVAGADTGLIQKTTDQTGAYTTYSYDNQTRLTEASTFTAGAVATGTSTWTWDPNGNRTQQTVNGAVTNYAYNAADQLCATSTGTATCPTAALAYDGNGNATTANSSTQTFSTYNQRTNSTTLGASTYSGASNNERVTGDGGGGYIATFTNSLFGDITRTTGTGNTEYVRDNQGTLIAIQNGGNSFYYTADVIGSIILLSNNTGASAATYKYDSFGNTPTPSGGIAATNKFRYAAGWAESDGTVKFGARWYDPQTGRFDQTDPSGQETNNYNYAGSNPITNTDPTGLDWGDVGAIIGSVVGGVAAAAACGATAGLGCIAAAAVVGASTSAAGGLFASGIAEEDVSVGDAVGWAAGGAASSVGFGIARGFNIVAS